MICIIGGGKMGAALVGGLTDHGHEVTIVETNATRREELQAEGRTVADKPVPCEGAIIAVKPRNVDVATSDAVAGGAKRILSIAAGVPLSRLHVAAGAHLPILRAMPNIGAVVERAAIALAADSAIHEEDVAWAEGLLSTVGTVVRVTEDQMDAVTGLSGSGPAYVLLLAEAMIDGGVTAGLSREVATELTLATVEGVGELLAQAVESPAELRAMVTTPAGTTAQGVRKLEGLGFRTAVIEAVLASAAHSAHIGHPAR